MKHTVRAKRDTHNISADYSILKYAQENKMFFITSDKESGAVHRARNSSHLFLDHNEITTVTIFDLVLSRL